MPVIEKALVWRSWRRSATNHGIEFSVVANLSELFAARLISYRQKAIIVIIINKLIKVFDILIVKFRARLIRIKSPISSVSTRS